MSPRSSLFQTCTKTPCPRSGENATTDPRYKGTMETDGVGINVFVGCAQISTARGPHCSRRAQKTNRVQGRTRLTRDTKGPWRRRASGSMCLLAGHIQCVQFRRRLFWPSTSLCSLVPHHAQHDCALRPVKRRLAKRLSAVCTVAHVDGMLLDFQPGHGLRLSLTRYRQFSQLQACSVTGSLSVAYIT